MRVAAFQASPLGETSGLLLACGVVGSVAVVVYPKLWRAAPCTHRVLWPEDEAHLTIALAELDRLELEASADRIALLTQEPITQGSADTAALLVPASSRIGRESATTAGPEPYDAVIALDELMRRLDLGSVIDSAALADGPNLDDPFLRPLLLGAFVDQVELQIQDARRGYIWRHESLTTLRGRVDPVSLVLNEATGWPAVGCTYEDFSRDTPVLVAIATALSVVAQEAGSGALSLRSIANRAITLRRMLSDVPNAPAITALRTCTRPPRGPDALVWLRALRLGTGVLQRAAGVKFAEGAHAVEIRVPTWRLWELVVLESLRTAGFEVRDGNDAGDPQRVEVSRPWIDLGMIPPRPDISIRLENGWSIADAKYKRLGPTPSADDLYQMFAYSHLGAAPAGEPISDLSLIYPALREEVEPSRGPFLRSRSPGASLRLHQLEFPSPGDIRFGWSEFLARNAELAAEVTSTRQLSGSEQAGSTGPLAGLDISVGAES